MRSKGQAWFWSLAWREMEAEATDDVAAGRYEDFPDIWALLRDLQMSDSTAEST